MDNDVAVQGGCKGLANIGPGGFSGKKEKEKETGGRGSNYRLRMESNS